MSHRTVTRRRMIAASGLTISGLAGCLGGGGNGGGSRTMSVITDMSSTDAQEGIQSAFETWKQEEGHENVEVEISFVGFDEFREQLALQVSSGDAPELALGPGAEVIQYYDSVQDVSGVIPDAVPDPYRFNIGGIEPKVPLSVSIASAWHRTDIYEEAGVEFGQTWDHHRENLDVLSQESDLNPEFISGNQSTGYTWYAHGVGFLQAGGQFISRESLEEAPTVVLDQEPFRSRVIDWLDYINDLYQYSPDTTTWGYDEATGTYVTGEGMLTRYPGRLAMSLVADAPELADVSQGMEYPRSPWQEEEDVGHIYPGQTQSWIAPTEEVGSSNPDLAMEFLDYFSGSEAYLDILLATPLHNVPTDISLLDRDRYLENEVVQAFPEYHEFCKEHIDGLRPNVSLSSRFDGNAPTFYWEPLVRGTELAPEMIATAAVGNKSPAEAVDDCAEGLRNELPRFEDEN